MGNSDLSLSPAHLTMLYSGSAISVEVAEARGYRTITSPRELEDLGFAPSQRRVPGLLLPLHTTDGRVGLYVYRPDSPREIHSAKGEVRVVKYEVPKGAGTRLDCPPSCRQMLADPVIPLWVTEGQKKADSLATRGLCALALLGVWNWRGRNDAGGITFLNDWDFVALNGRDVRLVFDSDVMSKVPVRQALNRLTEHLQRKGARVAAVYLPSERGQKVGVDDWLAQGHTAEELEALVEAPRPALKPAASSVELLDTPPDLMRRPLQIIGEHAYAAAWLPCRVTTTEAFNKAGELVRLDPPEVVNEIRLFVVRDDGAVFGDDADHPISDLGVEAALPEVPPASKTWTTAGVKRYRAGQRPDPVGVFAHVADVVDRFIDFNLSLGGQRAMAEMTACYILSTWFLDAFNVVGFLWPNGERGCGKTQLLLTICELAYLGQVILAGGSYASLRDLADYGATLAFDDAESVGDVRRTDPDKRALLLAGNRRGVTVSVKEALGERGWRTRYVNAFCPRLFSAIRLPDPILASRTIVVPLIRTLDRAKGNADPLDYALWPHDRRKLVDDLWALGLAYLSTAKHYDALVAERARLSGRLLEPWRAILATALWLQDHGAGGLFERIESLSLAYQTERPDLESTDLTSLVIRGLRHFAVSAISAISTETPQDENKWLVTTAMVVDATREAAEDEDIDDTDWINSRRVGRVLGSLRFQKGPRVDGRGARQWRISRAEVERWSSAYGLPAQEVTPEGKADSQPTRQLNLQTEPLSTNGGNGADGEMAQPVALPREVVRI